MTSGDAPPDGEGRRRPSGHGGAISRYHCAVRMIPKAVRGKPLPALVRRATARLESKS
jgi:hypothetical protein